MRRLSSGGARRIARLCEEAVFRLSEVENEMRELNALYGWKGGDIELRKCCADIGNAAGQARSIASEASATAVRFDDLIMRRSEARKAKR